MGPSANGEQSGDAPQPPTDQNAAGETRAQSPDIIASAAVLAKDHLVNDVIGRALQAHYRELAEAPLPDRFRVLLAELEAKGSQDD
jgi:hypothetical protein